MSKNSLLVFTSIILSIVMLFPVVFSIIQQQKLTLTEFESKKPSEISDAMTFLKEYRARTYYRHYRYSSKLNDFNSVLPSDNFRFLFLLHLICVFNIPLKPRKTLNQCIY